MALDWMPVDRAAGAVLEVAETLTMEMSGQGGKRKEEGEEEEEEEINIFHILNPHHEPTWKDLVRVVRASSSSPSSSSIDLLPPLDWLHRLETFPGDLPAKKLIGLWSEGFKASDGHDGEAGQAVTFE
ncbi:MAG: hypothetical protein LQ341_007854, partial [Variospora aurantia]